MSNKISIKEIARTIFRSYRDDAFGMFVGAGFSKAVLSDSDDYKALSWIELLEKVSNELAISLEWKEYHISPPEIASHICNLYSIKNDIDYDDAVLTFKSEISDYTNWYPTREAQEEFRTVFEELCPSWIVTTNYDMLLENILVEKCSTLYPNDVLVKKDRNIPIFHLHGARYEPQSIIITQEDYISLFRPNDYRQAKIPLLFKESTTLMIGYGLGDMNVLTAIDWMNHVYNRQRESEFKNELIQIVYTTSEAKKPYKKNGIIIIESNNLIDTLNMISKEFNKFVKGHNEMLELISETEEKLKKLPQKQILKFIKDSDVRIRITKSLLAPKTLNANALIDFYDRVFELNDELAYENGNFAAYDQKLNIILDYLCTYDLQDIPPAVMHLFSSTLARLSRHIGEFRGQSYDAARTWQTRKYDIPEQMRKELLSYCKCFKWNSDLSDLLE